MASSSTRPMPRPRLNRRGLIAELIETAVLIVSIYALVDLASVRYYVEGPSMEPNFYTGQRVIVSRINYMMTEPTFGEIVVVQSPSRPGFDPPLIKRIIGLPGDTLEIRNTQVLVNGNELFEPYINETCNLRLCPDNQWTLGPDEYFIMGDNRNHSNDSRAFGPITKNHIVGEVLVRYWPPQDWGLVSHINMVQANQQQE